MAMTASQAKSAGAGKHLDERGLYLVKTNPPRGKWILRLTVYGARREMGLGPYPDISLAEARRAAEDARHAVRNGKDPIAERHADKKARSNLLADVAETAFKARKSQLKDDGKAGRWFSPVSLHILPKLGKVPVTELRQTHIADTLSPIWHEKAATAQKALGRLQIILKHAAAMGLDVDLNVTAKAQALLGQSRHVVKNIPAMNWREVPAFYASLDAGTPVQLALRLMILTGARTSSVRLAKGEEFDGDVWTIPAEQMKGRKNQVEEFRVPLCNEAREVVQAALEFASPNGFLFPSPRKGALSDAAMARLMQRRGLDARPHGFRTSLRTWLAECTSASWELAETCIAHKVGSKVSRAYERTDHLEKRRPLMAAWANHVTGEGEADILQIGSR